jgi:general secretion pathway protein F
MARYRYTAVTPKGRTVDGELDARDPQSLADSLRADGVMMLHAEEAGRALVLSGRKRLKSDDLAALARQLATLLEVRLPLDRALEMLRSRPLSPAMAELAAETLDRVREGRTLSQALEEQRAELPPFFIGMVRAGETGGGGGLADVLARLADYLERSQKLRAKVRSALVYPAFLLVMVGVVITVMLTVVLPQFRNMFDEAGERLPALARWVMAAGDAAQAFWWAPPIVALLGFLMLRRSLADAGFRRRFDGWLLGLPLIGGLIRSIETARFATTLSAMLSNGVPLAPAMRGAAAALVNKRMREGVEDVAAALVRGDRLAARLGPADLFPPTATQLMIVGDESGRLQPMLGKVAEMYDAEARNRLDSMLALLTPAITVLLGLVVGAVIGGILSAMLSVYDLPM